MNCEQISEKAKELNIESEDIKIVKEIWNGWRIETINKEAQDKIKELKKFMYG